MLSVHEPMKSYSSGKGLEPGTFPDREITNLAIRIGKHILAAGNTVVSCL